MISCITTTFTLVLPDATELVITPDVVDGVDVLVVRASQPDDPFDWRVGSDGQEFQLGCVSC